MTTGSVFGNSNINNRPEFSGIDPRISETNTDDEIATALSLEQAKTALLQDAVAKFLNKEITKAELEIVQNSLK